MRMILWFVLTLAGASNALATPICATYKEMLGAVAEHWGEIPTTIASTTDGIVITITVNPKTQTWTMFGQKTADLMCFMSSGDGWEPAPDAIKALGLPGKAS